jgi:cytochrome c553
MKKLLSIAAAGTFAVLASATAFGAGDIEAGKAKSQACVACHGADGNSISPQFPKIAGQVPGYIATQLAAFKSGERVNGIMAGMVAGLSEQDMADLDAYYASLETKPGEAKDETLAKQGERLYRGGNKDMNIPACMSCHGPSGHGIPPKFPRVSGQYAEYTTAQLLAFKSGARKNDIMNPIAFRMSEQQIKAVAEYMLGVH